MKKEFIIQKKRFLDYVDVLSDREDVVVYTDNLLEDEVLIRSIQGVALKESVERVEKEDSVSNVAENRYELFLVRKSEFRELLRTTLMGRIPELPVIEDAYNFILSNGKVNEDSDYEVVQYGGRFIHRAKTMSGEFIPQAVHFDYMYSNGGLDNERYDLDEILEVLKDRKDIIWLNGKDRLRKGEILLPEVSKIPYYNATEESNKQLDFLWVPSDEDFAKVGVTEKEWKHYEIMKKIFGYDLEEM